MLNQSPILIVEDEVLIALVLKASVEDAGGVVVGPVGSVTAAMELVETADIAAAILDVQLSDGDVVPVAEYLCARGVPVIFQSGVSLPAGLKVQCPDAPFHKKPASAEELVKDLAALIDR
ncbi:MAG TPA: response regulator [Xanthobacteraceae bacterium]|nr:response regulator [Xanthobacteraceae bacterium]